MFEPGIHSIIVDPRDPDHVHVAVSSAGVIETTDGGQTSGGGRNRGMLMDYLPNPEAEWGHDPHFMTSCPGQPDHLWQQNHCGVFYSDDGAQHWRKVSKPDVGVHFGFPVAVDANVGRTAWVVPVPGSERGLGTQKQWNDYSSNHGCPLLIGHSPLQLVLVIQKLKTFQRQLHVIFPDRFHLCVSKSNACSVLFIVNFLIRPCSEIRWITQRLLVAGQVLQSAR